jgi:hypothetical protein
MSFKKPFRAVPIRPSTDYRAKLDSREFESDRQARKRTLLIAIAGLVIGGLLGGAYLTQSNWKPVDTTELSVAIVDPHGRLRTPQAGDWWFRCANARAAGTAPIFADEPGYRSGLDDDGDGIACESLPGY